MDIETIRKKVDELSALTRKISDILDEEETDIEGIEVLVASRQAIIDEFVVHNAEFDTSLQEQLRKIYEMDKENERKIKLILEHYAKNVRNAANAKKQISYYPKATNQEGLFIDEKS
ncbi:MAG: hypothetical protein GX166_11500 [Clostridiaceae bacterium]|nr:hypothetical protein [Clostridiaceae bacterium]